ncbi:PREDICTED: basic proline-rich protein-like [Elephantulus edwardii]|uniref:basic proline-rich protein-like n=1 Tax=Elephantulus edwardii TaxID=28737 RepID=UPI0003F0A570|nr:PREDICTED: basic proline-rich protein-like [Elephantulus edwardii]
MAEAGTAEGHGSVPEKCTQHVTQAETVLPGSEIQALSSGGLSSAKDARPLGPGEAPALGLRVLAPLLCTWVHTVVSPKDPGPRLDPLKPPPGIGVLAEDPLSFSSLGARSSRNMNVTVKMKVPQATLPPKLSPKQPPPGNLPQATLPQTTLPQTSLPQTTLPQTSPRKPSPKHPSPNNPPPGYPPPGNPPPNNPPPGNLPPKTPPPSKPLVTMKEQSPVPI